MLENHLLLLAIFNETEYGHEFANYKVSLPGRECNITFICTLYEKACYVVTEAELFLIWDNLILQVNSILSTLKYFQNYYINRFFILSRGKYTATL